MINGKRIAVVMPAYNAEKTLEKTVRELSDVVDIKILVDDSSKDKTAELSRKLGVQTFVHDANYGYGRNQQTCYREALAAGRGHRGDGASRLPVHAVAGSGHGGHDRQRRLRHGAGIADSGRRGAERRNAALQICLPTGC